MECKSCCVVQYFTFPPYTDITRTCYDVRLGAEHCRIPFPRSVPSGCCFAFSVLKRTYYVFSPTAEETKQWVECITSVSAILKRRQFALESSIPPPTGPSTSEHKKKSNSRHTVPGILEQQPQPHPEPRKHRELPMSVPPPNGPATSEHKKKSNRRRTVPGIMEEQLQPHPEPRKHRESSMSVPPPNGPATSEHKKKSNRRHTLPGIIEEQLQPHPEPGKRHTVIEPVEDQHARELNQLPVFTENPVPYQHSASSTPIYRDNSPLQYRSVPNSNMWLDGSPSPQLLHENAFSQPTPSPPQIERAKHRHHSASSAVFTSCDHNLHLKGLPVSSATLAAPLHRGATLPRPQMKYKPVYQALSTSALALQFQRLQHREAVLRRGLAMMDHPHRPHSVDCTTSPPHSYRLRSQSHIKSTIAVPAHTHSYPHHCSTSEILERSIRRNVPPIVKPKPILKSPKGSLALTQQEEFATPAHVRSTASNSPNASENTASVNAAGLAHHRYHHHVRSRSSPGPISSILLLRESPDSEQPFMPPPPLTAPPSSRPPAPSPPDSPPPPNVLEFLEPPHTTPQSHQSSQQGTPVPVWALKTSEREANNWALNELRKVS